MKIRERRFAHADDRFRFNRTNRIILEGKELGIMIIKEIRRVISVSKIRKIILLSN
jgi:hypothetical protein